MPIASLHRTFHTRIVGDVPALEAWADLFTMAERQVHVRLSRGETVSDIGKTGYRALGLNAKQFEHAMNSVRGKRDSAMELAKLHAVEIERRIKGKTKAIKKRERDLKTSNKAVAIAIKMIASQDRKVRSAATEQDRIEILKWRLKTVAELDAARRKRDAAQFAIHQHKRRVETLKHRLGKAQEAARNPSICFGTKGLFKAQFDLEANRLGSHDHWREEWRGARGGNVLIVGDALQSSGNSFAKLHKSDNGGFSLELRLPPALAHLADRTIRLGGSDQHVLMIGGLSFSHGADVIHKALAGKRPLTWRFVRDEVSWTAHVTVEDRREVTIDDFGRGCLAVDVNVDHLAVTQVAADGNPLRTWNVPCQTYGVSGNRAGNVVRHAVLQVVQLAKSLGVPIACERLDFMAKKAALEDERSPRRARMLSSFAYSAILDGLKTCAIRHGVSVRAVNPAYTSLIGRMKFARRYGLSVHASAALAIGRRAMNLSERPPSVDHVDEGLRVTLRRPEDRRRHVWRTWGRIARETAALAARGRAGRKAGSVGVEAKARTRLTGASPSPAEGWDSPRATTGPKGWPGTVAKTAVNRIRGSTTYSG